MSKPVIGITSSFENDRQYLNHTYIQAVEQSGGLPVIVPMMDNRDNLSLFTNMLDGLVVSGGPAVITGLIGDLPADLPPTDPIRSRADEWVLDAAVDQNQPILGICYGMQLLNARAGGKIYADIQKLGLDYLPHSEDRGGAVHSINITPGSRLARLMDSTELIVNSSHIQALAEVASSFLVTATSPDGVVEAIESTDGLMIGVQFHPEKMLPIWLPLFVDLVKKASEKSKSLSLPFSE